jgi:hypothetical protein
MGNRKGGFAMCVDCARAIPYHRCFSSLVMEILSALFKKSESWELMQPLRASQIKHRASLYVDDIFIFLATVEGELNLSHSIFQIF